VNNKRSVDQIEEVEEEDPDANPSLWINTRDLGDPTEKDQIQIESLKMTDTHQLRELCNPMEKCLEKYP
jgi:hypothetical protein